MFAGRKVHAIDANGAGDAFAGAFLYAVNAGLGLHTAAQLAILISSEVVSQFGPRWLWQITPNCSNNCKRNVHDAKNLHDRRHP